MVTALIVAAGKGKRFGAGFNKQYFNILGKEIIARTLEKFEDMDFIDNIVVVVSNDEIEYFNENIVKKYAYKKIKRVVAGGEERQHSVYNGLLESKEADIVVIHDGARPFVKKEQVLKAIDEARIHGASALAVNVKDTIKVAEGGYFTHTPNRSTLYAVQTPQVFKYDIIINAHEFARKNNIITTDDTSLVELIGQKVRIVDGSYDNIKITTPEDIYLAEMILKK